MAGKLSITLRERVFHFAWCNRTELDKVCTVCGSIVPGETCQYCHRQHQKKAENLRKFLEQKAKEAPQ